MPSEALLKRSFLVLRLCPLGLMLNARLYLLIYVFPLSAYL